jgi:hypothetical protein
MTDAIDSMVTPIKKSDESDMFSTPSSISSISSLTSVSKQIGKGGRPTFSAPKTHALGSEGRVLAFDEDIIAREERGQSILRSALQKVQDGDTLTARVTPAAPATAAVPTLTAATSAVSADAL